MKSSSNYSSYEEWSGGTFEEPLLGIHTPLSSLAGISIRSDECGGLRSQRVHSSSDSKSMMFYGGEKANGYMTHGLAKGSI